MHWNTRFGIYISFFLRYLCGRSSQEDETKYFFDDASEL